MYFKIGSVLKNFANFTGKHRCWSLFLIKLQAFMARASIKTVNVKDNVCCVVFPFFIMRVTEENGE